jgi:hypothetical protein
MDAALLFLNTNLVFSFIQLLYRGSRVLLIYLLIHLFGGGTSV